MSDASEPRSPWSQEPAPARPRPGRWLQRLSAVLLVGAVAVVGLAASPAVLRAAGLTRTSTTTRAGALRRPGHVVLDPRPELPRPFAVPEQDDGRLDGEEEEGGLERLYPDDPRKWPGGPDDPHARRAPEPRDRSGARPPAPAAPDPAQGIELGLARRPLRLFDDPAGSVVVGEVDEGQMVMIVRERGDWALVVHSGGGNVVMGWVRKSEIAVR